MSELQRAAVEQAIEALIALLDLTDGEPDIEDDDPDMEHDGREPE